MEQTKHRIALSVAKAKLNKRRLMINRFISMWGNTASLNTNPALALVLAAYRRSYNVCMNNVISLSNLSKHETIQ